MARRSTSEKKEGRGKKEEGRLVTSCLLPLTSYLIPMFLYIALGSAIGGVSRSLLGGLIQRLLDTTFPAGTLLVNISGSFLLGAILRYAIDTPTLSPEV